MMKAFIATLVLLCFSGSIFSETLVYVCDTGEFLDWMNKSMPDRPSGLPSSALDPRIRKSKPDLTEDQNYGNLKGIDDTANQLLADFLAYMSANATDGQGKPNSFFVAGHSLGGLAARRMFQLAAQDQRFKGKLKGYIESGTPNQGSRLADREWLARGVLPLAETALASALFTSIWLPYPKAGGIERGGEGAMPLDSLLPRMEKTEGRGISAGAASLFESVLGGSAPDTPEAARSLSTRASLEVKKAEVIGSFFNMLSPVTGTKGAFWLILSSDYSSLKDLIPGSPFLQSVNSAGAIAIEKKYARASVMSNDDDIYDVGPVWHIAKGMIATSTLALATAVLAAAFYWWNPPLMMYWISAAASAALSLYHLAKIPQDIRYLCGGSVESGRTDTLVPYNDNYKGIALRQSLPGGATGNDFEHLVPRLSHADGALKFDDLRASNGNQGAKTQTAIELQWALGESYRRLSLKPSL
jgi:hypothetical protein